MQQQWREGEVMYGKGYRPDPAGHAKMPFHMLLARRGIAADMTLPSTWLDLADKQPPIMDQSSTSSCVGHSLSAAIYTTLNYKAAPLPFVPSPKDIYTNARCGSRQQGQPLADDGCQPNLAISGVGEWGVRAMTPLAGRYSDCSPDTVNAEPAFGELEEDARNLIMGAYAITSVGAQLEQDIKLALFHGFPVCNAVDASDNGPVQQYQSGDVIDNMGTNLDHYVCSLKYRTVDGKLQLGQRNSWNEAYGDNGYFWIEGVAIQQLGDLWVIDIRRVVSP